MPNRIGMDDGLMREEEGVGETERFEIRWRMAASKDSPVTTSMTRPASMKPELQYAHNSPGALICRRVAKLSMQRASASSPIPKSS